MIGVIEDIMAINIIEDIPIELNVEELLEKYTIEPSKKNELDVLVKKYQKLIEAKAVYSFVKVKNIINDEVHFYRGDVFRGIILADMLEPQQLILLFVATAGPKVDAQIAEDAKNDAFQRVYSAKIGNAAVGKASLHLKHLAEKKLGKDVTHFGPGRGGGKLFGIEQQKVVFHILNPARNIGVKLMPNYLMIPIRSISGIYAVSRLPYNACQHCPREICDGRTTPYIGEYHSNRRPH